MSFRNPTYSKIAARITDWLQTAPVGGEVSNITLDLINRAQDELVMMLPWEGLVKRVEITLTNKVGVVPTDMAHIIAVGEDADGDNKIDKQYYSGDTDVYGYFLELTGDKDTKFGYTINFYNAPNNPIMMEYQMALEEFTGEGTEYSFFPAHLITLQAQLIHITETGLTGAEMQMIDNQFQKAFNDFRENHQYMNQAPRMRMNDSLGNEVFVPGFSLNSGSNYQNNLNRCEPSRI